MARGNTQHRATSLDIFALARLASRRRNIVVTRAACRGVSNQHIIAKLLLMARSPIRVCRCMCLACHIGRRIGSMRTARHNFHRPVVRLIRALYGHPDAGTCWEENCDRIMKEKGFVAIE